MTKTKCTIHDGTHIEPCDMLREMTEGPAATSKARGIYVWAFHSRQTGQPTRTIYGIRTSARPKGLILNFCPWCGADHTPAQRKEQP